MSATAERYVDTYTHPNVNEAARDVLKAIARLIPEGQTTTPAIGMADLAKQARLHRRTVWRWLDVLVTIGEVRVLDGGQGRPARYTLVHVAGAAPIADAPLPLRADLRPVRRRAAADGTTPGLFDRPSVRSNSEETPITRITRITSWASPTITRITSWAANTITRITSTARFRRREGERLVIRTCDPCDPAPLTTTNYVLSTKNDPEGTYELGGGVARARDGTDLEAADVERFLAWWTATYPTHNAGALTTIDRARDGFIVRELLTHGRTVERLQALALVLWSVAPDEDPRSDRSWIATKTDRSIRILRRKVNLLELWHAQQSVPAGAGDDKDWNALRDEAERRLGRDWRKSG